MKTVFLSLGSNKGDRLKNIKSAYKLINSEVGTIIKYSDIFESESWGYEDEKYLNSTVKILTNLSPFELLNKIKEIEKKLGRNTKTKIINNKKIYSAREIDIDILFYENEIINTENLTVPHPLLHKRKFILMPLMQTAKDFIHPVYGKTVKKLSKECNDKSSVYKKAEL